MFGSRVSEGSGAGDFFSSNQMTSMFDQDDNEDQGYNFFQGGNDDSQAQDASPKSIRKALAPTVYSHVKNRNPIDEQADEMTQISELVFDIDEPNSHVSQYHRGVSSNRKKELKEVLEESAHTNQTRPHTIRPSQRKENEQEVLSSLKEPSVMLTSIIKTDSSAAIQPKSVTFNPLRNSRVEKKRPDFEFDFKAKQNLAQVGQPRQQSEIIHQNQGIFGPSVSKEPMQFKQCPVTPSTNLNTGVVNSLLGKFQQQPKHNNLTDLRSSRLLSTNTSLGGGPNVQPQINLSVPKLDLNSSRKTLSSTLIPAVSINNQSLVSSSKPDLLSKIKNTLNNPSPNSLNLTAQKQISSFSFKVKDPLPPKSLAKPSTDNHEKPSINLTSSFSLKPANSLLSKIQGFRNSGSGLPPVFPKPTQTQLRPVETSNSKKGSPIQKIKEPQQQDSKPSLDVKRFSWTNSSNSVTKPGPPSIMSKPILTNGNSFGFDSSKRQEEPKSATAKFNLTLGNTAPRNTNTNTQSNNMLLENHFRPTSAGDTKNNSHAILFKYTDQFIKMKAATTQIKQKSMKQCLWIYQDEYLLNGVARLFRGHREKQQEI